MGIMSWLRPKIIKVSILLMLLSSVKGFGMSPDTKNVIEFFKKKYSNYSQIEKSSPVYASFKKDATTILEQLLKEAELEFNAGKYSEAITTYDAALEFAEALGGDFSQDIAKEKLRIQKICKDRIATMLKQADTFIQAMQYNGAFQVLEKALDIARKAGLTDDAQLIEQFMAEIANKFNEDKNVNAIADEATKDINKLIDQKGWDSAQMQARLFLHLDSCFKSNNASAFVFMHNGESTVVFTESEINSMIRKVKSGKIKKFAIDKLRMLAQIELDKKIKNGLL